MLTTGHGDSLCSLLTSPCADEPLSRLVKAFCSSSNLNSPVILLNHTQFKHQIIDSQINVDGSENMTIQENDTANHKQYECK